MVQYPLSRDIIGIKDTNVQKELLKIRDLTLNKAVDICKTSEKAASHNLMMRLEINKIQQYNKFKDKNNVKKSCKFCGAMHRWGKDECPTYGKTCSACQGPNHFAKVCNAKTENKEKKRYPNKSNYKKKSVNKIDRNDDSEDDSEWINNVMVNKINEKQVKCNMLVNENLVPFQIDTGSSVNILPIQYLNSESVSNTDVVLKTWNGNSYNPVGECRQIIRNPKNEKKI